MKVVHKKLQGWRIIITVLVIMLFGSNLYWGWKWREQMRVTRVIDGDTFVIKTGDRVRLFGLDAPEANTCYAQDSKGGLEKLVLDKIVKLDRDERDGFGRKIGIVTVGNVNVNLEMVKSGLAVADKGEFDQEKTLAEVNNLGVYAGVCTSDTTCAILGNIDESNGRKYYHLLDCRSYSKVKISPERGEKRFCSEEEAKADGFVLVPDCYK